MTRGTLPLKQCYKCHREVSLKNEISKIKLKNEKRYNEGQPELRGDVQVLTKNILLYLWAGWYCGESGCFAGEKDQQGCGKD